MKIYKVYEERGESRENSKERFTSILTDANGGRSFFTTDREEALRHYDSIAIWLDHAQKTSAHHITFYVYDGKFLEVSEISDEDYKRAVEEGDSIEDIFGSSNCWDFEKIDVSEEYKEKEDEGWDE